MPSANMLQHFKSDASRTDRQGVIHGDTDARYSQSTHPVVVKKFHKVKQITQKLQDRLLWQQRMM